MTNCERDPTSNSPHFGKILKNVGQTQIKDYSFMTETLHCSLLLVVLYDRQEYPGSIQTIEPTGVQ